MSEQDHFVEIVRTDSGEVVNRMGPMTECKADKVDEGANINLNHAEYHTRILKLEEVVKATNETKGS